MNLRSHQRRHILSERASPNSYPHQTRYFHFSNRCTLTCSAAKEALVLCLSSWFLLFVPMETDIHLLKSARRMKKDALVRIFDLYAPALFKYALRLCGDPVMADHIVGDVFANLLDQLSSRNGPRTNLRSYLYQATYHEVVDEVHYSQRRAPLEAAAALQPDRRSLLPAVENKIFFTQVLHALRTHLTDDQRHVLILRFLEGCSVRETAAIMDKKTSTVKVIQNRAIAALRKTLAHT